MAPTINIEIPKTSVGGDSKPFTLYEISVRLPLQVFYVSRRYSEFATLHSALKQQAGSDPPASLPPKHYFSRTTNNVALTESRRAGLEVYLRTINNASDPRWCDTPAWRSFLNLPNSLIPKSHHHGQPLHTGATEIVNKDTSDPVLWLDVHREIKSSLQTIRLNILSNDIGEAAHSDRERSAEAKKVLIRADALIANLEKGLEVKHAEWGTERLGQGEVRRRRDLITKAKLEKNDLLDLLATIAKKKDIDEAVEAKEKLIESNPSGVGSRAQPSISGVRRGRVLGKETSKTRELDNDGVLQLQQQMMREQDEDLLSLVATVRRQKELAVQINEELEIQTEMLGMLDEDATRLENKMGVARKRVDKIR